MCSDPGQELIQQDIREHKLNRIVVASCSPLLHEHTFRSAAAAGGLNPFFFQMVNIREHDSWVHTDRAAATAKAKALVRAAVGACAYHKPLETKQVPIHPDVLVVGGGIAGIHAALTLANAGKQVYLVEREPTIGGHMAKFDKTFPTLDCAACILTPKMSAVGAHPNITLWTYSEVTKVEGYVGNYKVTVKRKPRYVNEDLCVGCQECIDACVYKEAEVPRRVQPRPEQAQADLHPLPAGRAAGGAHRPRDLHRVQDRQVQEDLRRGLRRPEGHRLQPEGGDQGDQGRHHHPGHRLQDLRRQAHPVLRLRQLPNVYTALEVERLVNASGPTGGEVILRDGTQPQDGRHHPLRRLARREHQPLVLARLLHVLAEAGAPAQGAHRRRGLQLLHRHAHARARATRSSTTSCSRKASTSSAAAWPRSPTGRMTPEEEGKLVIRVEDTLAGFVRRIPVDMVVLADGPGAAGRRAGGAAPVQHQLRHRRLLPGAASQAGAGEHLHRRHLHRRLPARGRRTSPTPWPRPAPPPPRPWR